MSQEGTVRQLFHAVYGFRAIGTISGRAYSGPELQRLRPNTRLGPPQPPLNLDYRELELRAMSHSFKSEPPQGELWFQNRADVGLGGEVVARALLCIDISRGRDFSSLVAVLRDNGDVHILVYTIPLPTLTEIIAKFQILYADFQKERAQSVQSQPPGE